MKYILFFLLLPFTILAQDILFETTEVEERDGLFYVKTVIITDNSTTVPDTAITRELLGTKDQAAQYFSNEAIRTYSRAGFIMSQAIQWRDAVRTFGEIRTIYSQLGLGDIYPVIATRLKSEYEGYWRFFDAANNQVWVEAVLAGNGVLRFHVVDRPGGTRTGTTYNARPLANNAFLLLAYEGQNWYFFKTWVREGSETWFPEEKVGNSSGSLRFTKDIEE